MTLQYHHVQAISLLAVPVLYMLVYIKSCELVQLTSLLSL